MIPGTNLYCYAPSSTHEQPDDIVDGSAISKSDHWVKTALKTETPQDGWQTGGELSNEGADANQAPPPAASNSPMAFLKSMSSGGGNKGKTGSRESSKSRGDSGERHSILDSLLRRGRSRSASRNSSRQSSVDRGEGGVGASGGAGGGRNAGGSARMTDSSHGGSEAGGI